MLKATVAVSFGIYQSFFIYYRDSYALQFKGVIPEWMRNRSPAIRTLWLCGYD